MIRIKKLDIGCGTGKQEGFIGIDIDNVSDADIILDVSKDILPFIDNSVDEVYSNNLFEHLDIDGMWHCLQEIYRVCKNGAKVTIKVPYMVIGLEHKTWWITHDFFDDLDMTKKWERSNRIWKMNFKVKYKWVRGKRRFWRKYGLIFTMTVVKGGMI